MQVFNVEKAHGLQMSHTKESIIARLVELERQECYIFVYVNAIIVVPYFMGARYLQEAHPPRAWIFPHDTNSQKQLLFIEKRGEVGPKDILLMAPRPIFL
jgi:hypothetical protein